MLIEVSHQNKFINQQKERKRELGYTKTIIPTIKIVSTNTLYYMQ